MFGCYCVGYCVVVSRVVSGVLVSILLCSSEFCSLCRIMIVWVLLRVMFL